MNVKPMKPTEPMTAYHELFDRLKTARGNEPSWLRSFRENALERFDELGFPHTKMEEWRFTSVAPLLQTSFHPAEPPPAKEVEAALVDFTLGRWKRTRLVFINGRYSPELSSFLELPRGVIVKSLEAALRESPELVEAYLARHGEYKGNAFAALNLALLTDGAFICLPEGSLVEDPIHLLYFSASNAAPTISFPHNLIVAGPHSQATILESYVGRESEVYFTNAVTEVHAGNGAVIDHYKLQRESPSAFHVANVQFHQGRGASVSGHSISLGARLARNDIKAVLDGEGGDCTLNGIYVGRASQHVDHHTVIDHAKPNCSSRELYKGILDEQARAVFNGRIVVRPEAQKTDARQTNRNLLLSDEALVNTNPQLEIYADDVKCAHGATIGQLDADALFYLRSRGIDEKTARTLLIHGFLADMGQRIRIDAVRSGVECILMTSLPQGQGQDHG